jgi:DNA-binding NtrC family response regulator
VLGSRLAEAIPQNDDSLSLRENERLHIARVLRRTGGNVTEAAAILGIARRTLYDRIKSLDVAIDP